MQRPRTSLSISVRRHFVDEFFFSQSSILGRETKIVDIGGKKVRKRGLFDLARYGADVTYVNTEKADEPDVLADASSIPLPDHSFDIAIMGEILEHLPDPIRALKEASRLLKPGGKLLATVPFLYPIHADPDDYGRYTDSYWREAARLAGFSSVETKRQGAMFAVIALMVQHFFRAKGISWRPIQNSLVSWLMSLDRRTKAPLLMAWTTGFGLIFHK